MSRDKVLAEARLMFVALLEGLPGLVMVAVFLLLGYVLGDQ